MPSSTKFQLTHSRGVRLYAQLTHVLRLAFQLTHSRGVRPNIESWLHNAIYFNSRTHVECDRIDLETGEIR